MLFDLHGNLTTIQWYNSIYNWRMESVIIAVVDIDFIEKDLLSHESFWFVHLCFRIHLSPISNNVDKCQKILLKLHRRKRSTKWVFRVSKTISRHPSFARKICDDDIVARVLFDRDNGVMHSFDINKFRCAPSWHIHVSCILFWNERCLKRNIQINDEHAQNYLYRCMHTVCM